MHVIGGIRGDEVEARDGIVDQILCQFRVGADVVSAILEIVPDLVEKDKRVVPDRVVLCINVRIRTGISRDTFLIGLPGNVGAVQLGDKIVRGALVIVHWRVVIANAEIGP